LLVVGVLGTIPNKMENKEDNKLIWKKPMVMGNKLKYKKNAVVYITNNHHPLKLISCNLLISKDKSGIITIKSVKKYK
jgi:hypothetical protein